MSYGTHKGYIGEIESSEFFNKLVAPKFHICRVGGIEARKMVLSGDVSLLSSCRKHRFKGQIDIKECDFYDTFIEVKDQANPNIWKTINKAEDDAELAGKTDVILYVIKQKRGEKGERLIVMRPSTFNKFYTL